MWLRSFIVVDVGGIVVSGSDQVDCLLDERVHQQLALRLDGEDDRFRIVAIDRSGALLSSARPDRPR